MREMVGRSNKLGYLTSEDAIITLRNPAMLALVVDAMTTWGRKAAIETKSRLARTVPGTDDSG
jgi:hypothetical protein